MLQNHYTQFFFFKMAAVILSVTSILYDSDRVFYIFLTGNTVSNNYKYILSAIYHALLKKSSKFAR